MAESSHSSENVQVVFSVHHGAVEVVFQKEVYSIGYLDLNDHEKLLLESANFDVSMTMDPNKISFAADKFVLNHLTDPDEIYKENQQCLIRCSLNENIVNYNQSYYFASETLEKKFRQLARLYKKDMDSIAFCLKKMT